MPTHFLSKVSKVVKPGSALYDAQANMLKKLLFLLGSAFVLAGCSLPGALQKKAGLTVRIANDEPTSITLDNLDVGQAPYDSTDLKPGSYTLKLTPQNTSKPAYETNVTLTSGLVTVVTWSFGNTAEESSGEIFELAKSSGGKTELSIVTTPDNIIVKVDGQSKGFSPLILDDLAAGSHQLTLTAPGYVERTSNPKLEKGYRVTVTSKLGREPESTTPTPTPSTASATPSPSPSASPKTSASPKPSPSPTTTSTASQSGVITTTTTPAFPYVEIQTTETGWLRVRAESSGSSAEVAKLSSGSKVPYKGESVSGWHKVEYQTGKLGWVSGQYAVVHSQ